MTHPNRNRHSTAAGARRRLAALLPLAALLASPAWATRRAAAGAEAPPPSIAASILTLDFDPRDGATVIGITSSAPLTNHTIYEPDASTVVVELPDADVSRLEPVATIGTPEVSRVKVEAVVHAATTSARLVIERAPGVRRTVALDPRNPKRLEITLQAAAAPAPAATELAAMPSAPARVLASVAPPAPAAAPPAPRPVPSSAGATPVAVAAPTTAHVASPVPRPVVVRESATVRASTPPPGSGAAPALAPRGPGKLTDLTVESSGDGRTLVRLTGTRQFEPRTFLLDDRPRLVVDLPDTINALSIGNLPVRDSEVLKVRVSQNEPLPSPVTRVVVDWTAEQPFELIPGPDALLIAIGRPSAGAPAMASAGWAAGAPLSSPDGPLVSGPGGALANLGRPSTSSGLPPGPIAAGGGMRPLRETADAGQVIMTPSSSGARFDEVAVTSTETVYTGEPISITVKDADLQDLFRLFHQVSGLNIVVDPSVRGKTITLELVDVPWDQAMDLVLKTQGLGQTLEGNVLRIAPITKLAQEEQQAKQLKEAQELSGEVTQTAFPLSYAQGSQAETIIRKSLSQRGDVTLDRRTNTLIIKDLPARIEAIKSLLALLDQPTKQVMIEARIVETTLDFSKAVGIQWGFNYIADRAFGNSTGFSFPRSVATDYAVNLPVTAAASTLGLSFRNILNTFALDLQISALEDRGKARIISRPMVMVQNNESAQIESGVQIPISNTTATEIEVTFVSASLKLTVEPQITADDTVIMDLRVENNAPVFIQAAGDNTSISTRQAQTVVAVPNGGTTVIGGIYQVNEGATSTRVPFMSRIPLLGWLFRNKTMNRTNDELLIFITPRIQKA